MARKKAETPAEEATTTTASVTWRLVAQAAQDSADWCELIAEAATIGVEPPPEVVEQMGHRLQLDQPKFRFRHLVDLFRTGVEAIHATHRASERLEKTEAELGSRDELAANIRRLEADLAVARRALTRRDAAATSVHIHRGKCMQVIREAGGHINLHTLEEAAGKSLPSPRK